jgi:thiol reductant ABC exporter CydC subunit
MTGPWRRLCALLRPESRGFAAGAALQFATIASGIGLMATSAWLISTASLHPSIAALGVAIVGVRFFGLSRGVFRYLERLASHHATLSLLARLRVTVFEALSPLAPARLRAHRSGDLVSRLVDDVDSLDNFYVRVLGPSLAATLTAILVCALLIPRGAALALAVVIGLAVAGVVAPAIALLAGAQSGARTVTLRADLAARTADAVQGLSDLVAFNQSAAYRAELERRSLDLAAAQISHVRISAGASACVVLAGDMTAIAVLVLAVPLVRSGALAGVQLAVVVLTTLAAFEVAGPLAAAWQNLGATRAAARRLHALLDGEPAVPVPVVPLPPPQGRILDVRGLTFRYQDSESDTLNNVSFSLAPGRCVAIVGSSGAGKSTIASLLLRFQEAPAGSIMLDGQDVRGYAADEVRACLAYADQRASIVTGTIRENLLIAHPGASGDAIMEALDAVGLSGLVRQLPDGLDTWVGEQGHRLSGGERQRLALARAILKPSPFVILDEPTAHLDPMAERHVLAALRRMAHTRGVLLITHRVVGIDFASEIVVLQDGHVVQQGAFAELRKEDGWFRRMLDLQRSAVVVEERVDAPRLPSVS